MTLKRLAFTFCLLLIPFSAHSQQAVIQNPQAVALATQALAALTGTTPVSEIPLTGTATRTAGSDIESGSITLKALGNPDSRFDLVYGDKERDSRRIGRHASRIVDNS
jgi:hypothetical protein